MAGQLFVSIRHPACYGSSLRTVHKIPAAMLGLLLVALPATSRAQLVQPEFLYKLSSLTGVLPLQGVNVVYDPYNHEVLVVAEGRVRIFNSSAMEVFSFGEDPAIGGVSGAAPVEDGDFLLLSFREARPSVVRANFRGELKSRIELTGIPSDYPSDLGFNAIGYAKERIYLANLGAMRLVVFDMAGKFLAHHDLMALADPTQKAGDHGIRGFRVAPNGDVLFTIPTLFKACILSADGTYKSFGIKGSAPGKFNVISGIAVDEKGYYYVADILKSAVLVFDKDFRWLKEFGYRGNRPGSIFSPVDLAAGGGKVYVSQYARKGVSVFKINVIDAP
jgi:hypothetical protein